MANHLLLGDVAKLWHGASMSEISASTPIIETRWPAAWSAVLTEPGVREAVTALANFLRDRETGGTVVYPPKEHRLRALHALFPR